MTPDKTIDVSKLVSEARNKQFGAMYRPFNCSDCRKDIPALCDALESAAKENAELAEELVAVTKERDDFDNTNALLWDDITALRLQLAAVAKERDAAVEALTQIESFQPSSHIEEPYRAIATFGKVTARAALEKLNAK
jgi:hypothetical protein